MLTGLLDIAGFGLTLLALCLLAAGGYLGALRLLGEEEARRDLLGLAVASLLLMTAEAVGIGLALGALGILDFRFALLLQALLVAALALAARRRRSAEDAAAAGAGGGTVATGGGGAGGAGELARRIGRRLREHPALALITLHAAGSELLRGVLRPPLSFDSLMYHLLLAANWLQERNLKVFSASFPISDYAYVPANGSVWLWWWMAPSHSELYANLSAMPQWLLLGLAAGALARHLGARRQWPLASFLVLLTPTVVRFLATQYVDIFTGGVLVAACFFLCRWLAVPRWREALLAGAGAGLACGAKIIGVPYWAALAAAAVLLVPWRGAQWRRRAPQAAAALLLTAALGSFFYLRNLALGAGPLALYCEGRVATEEAPAKAAASAAASATWGPWRKEAAAPATPAKAPEGPGPAGAAGAATAAAGAKAPEGPGPAATSTAAATGAGGAAATGTDSATATGTGSTATAQATASKPPLLPHIPRPQAPLDLWQKGHGDQILDSFLGITRLPSVELGLGTQSFLLLLALLVLPWGVAAPERRAALLVASQIAFELVFWLTVPYAGHFNIFANLRYLIPAAGLALAGGVAVAEQCGMNEAWLDGLAIALACQALLEMHSEMPRGVRLAMAACDVAAAAIGFSSAGRAALVRHRRALIGAALLAMVAAVPFWAHFRVVDRGRALTTEWTTHSTSANVFAAGWRWLDASGGNGTVAVISTPSTYFIYPAMGPYLERKVRYINVNRANYQEPSRYPFCNPRVDPSFPAWIANLQAGGVRWLLVSRYPTFDWPPERDWAAANPGAFTLQFADQTNQIYEFLLAPAAASAR